jgi:hypothetical protein
VELHGDSGNHAEEKIDGEDFAPEASGDVVVGLGFEVGSTERKRLKDDDEQCQSRTTMSSASPGRR